MAKVGCCLWRTIGLDFSGLVPLVRSPGRGRGIGL